jgi:non-ribosomal peptide synthetase component E (peptide arylation enzyme)
MEVTMGLRRAALIRGSDTAVIDGGVRRTWREEQDRVARVAGALKQVGLERGEHYGRSTGSVSNGRFIE